MIIECCSEIVSLFLPDEEAAPLSEVCISFKTVCDSLTSIVVAMEMEIQKTSIMRVSRA